MALKSTLSVVLTRSKLIGFSLPHEANAQCPILLMSLQIATVSNAREYSNATIPFLMCVVESVIDAISAALEHSFGYR